MRVSLTWTNTYIWFVSENESESYTTALLEQDVLQKSMSYIPVVFWVVVLTNTSLIHHPSIIVKV